jgi:iron transport multicopper oxidase
MVLSLAEFDFCIIDPNDPLGHLYDVDDGEKLHFLTLSSHTGSCPIPSYNDTDLTCPLSDSTIITLADWYHDLAPDAQNEFFQTLSVP